MRPTDRTATNAADVRHSRLDVPDFGRPGLRGLRRDCSSNTDMMNICFRVQRPPRFSPRRGDQQVQAPNTVVGRSPFAWDEATKYKTLFDSIDEGFCVVQVQFDTHGKAIDYVFMEVNPAFERQTGLVDAVGHSMRSLAPEHEEHWFQIYGDVARTGNATRFDAQAQALGRWYDVYAFAFGSEGADLVGILFNDVSRRKELERAVELQNQQLREAVLRKDRFLATLSHELRNPLAPLAVAAELLGQPHLSEEQLLQTRHVIRRQVSLMARLVDDLLDVARVTQGKLELKREMVRCHAIIDMAVEAVRPLIERKQHILEVDLDSVDPWLFADPVRLEQVVANLLVNAAKHTDPGGLIQLGAKLQGDVLSIRVQDDGIGLETDTMARLFEMFSQDAGATQQAEGGLGIGLYLVRQFVNLHGGEAHVHSEGPGCGSTFTVRLPIACANAQHQHAVASAPQAEARSATRHKILIADDNRDAADMLGNLLEMKGHQVRVTYDGPSAMAHARTFRPDIAILDIGMPKMDGHELARKLRAEAWAEALVLVAATGWGSKDARAETVSTGFHHHLTKPISLNDLDRILEHPTVRALQ